MTRSITRCKCPFHDDEINTLFVYSFPTGTTRLWRAWLRGKGIRTGVFGFRQMELHTTGRDAVEGVTYRIVQNCTLRPADGGIRPYQELKDHSGKDHSGTDGISRKSMSHFHIAMPSVKATSDIVTGPGGSGGQLGFSRKLNCVGATGPIDVSCSAC